MNKSTELLQEDDFKYLGDWEARLYKHARFCAKHLIVNKTNPYLRVFVEMQRPVIRAAIETALRIAHGNKTKAAKSLGMNRGTLKIYLAKYFKKYEIDRLI